MAQQSISLDNTSALPLFTTMASNPAISGSYVYSIGAVPGVVAANNFISLFNPSGSGKNVSLGAAYVSSFCIAAALTPAPMNGFRITAASAGTLQTNSTAVTKFQTSMPTSVCEIRTGNPTCTIGAQIFNASPAVAGGANGTSTVQNIAAAPAVYPPFVLVPGEGVVLRTTAGLVNTLWNLSIVWAEL
jgi:hypothetical protein